MKQKSKSKNLARFTEEEIEMLKKIAQERIWAEKCFCSDEKGNPLPRGNYSDWVKSMLKQT